MTGRPGSQERLERLERQNVFTQALDERRTTFRYHALFADALLRRVATLPPDHVRAHRIDAHCAQVELAQRRRLAVHVEHLAPRGERVQQRANGAALGQVDLEHAIGDRLDQVHVARAQDHGRPGVAQLAGHARQRTERVRAAPTVHAPASVATGRGPRVRISSVISGSRRR